MATKTVDKKNKKPSGAKSAPAPARHVRTSSPAPARAGAAGKARPAARADQAAKASKAPAKGAKAAPKPGAVKAKATAAKPAPTPKSTAKPQAGKPAPQPTKSKTDAGKKAPAKPAPKPAAKAPPAKTQPTKAPAAAKGQPAPKAVTPKAATTKTAAAKPDAQKAAAAKPEAAVVGKKSSQATKPAKPATRKKLVVGQKPRSPKPSELIVPATIIAQQKAAPSVNSAPVKPTPASLEAKQEFKVNDHIVYPAHGVGRIVSIEKQVIAGITNELFLIEFEQEKMKLRVPTAKAKAVGMRGLSDPHQVKKAVELLKGRARIKRTMWSRRAQEYEAKINSGDIMSVAEVVRDLFRASDQPEQSYSERQLFEAALDRLAREVAAVNKTDLAKAIADLEAALAAKKAA